MSASETVTLVVSLSAGIRRIDAGSAKALRHEIGVAEYLGDDRMAAFCAASGRRQSGSQPVLRQEGEPVFDVAAPSPGVVALRLKFSAHA